MPGTMAQGGYMPARALSFFVRITQCEISQLWQRRKSVRHITQDTDLPIPYRYFQLFKLEWIVLSRAVTNYTIRGFIQF